MSKILSILKYKGVYYTFNIIQAALSVASLILVLRFHFRGHKQCKLPRIIEKLVRLNNKINSFNSLVVSNSSRSQLKNSGSILNSSFIRYNKPKSINIESKNEMKYIKSISHTLYSIKKMHKEIKKEKKLIDINEANLVEWKEAARILDNVFFFFSFIAVTLTPIYLFHQYLIEESPESFNKLTRCLNQ